MSVSVLIKTSCPTTGEGPHWDDRSNCLLYVDIHSGEIHRYDTVTEQDEKIVLDGSVGHVIPRSSGGYVVGLGRRLVAVEWNTKSVTDLTEVDHGKETRFNDGKCDPSGRLWAGTMGKEERPGELEPNQGTLYSLEVDGSLKTRYTPVSISNGLAWSADNTTMFYVDSFPRQMYAFDFDITTGSLSNKRIVADFSGSPKDDLGFPDGMCMDTTGKLWVACFFGSKVVCIDPGTGSIVRKVSFPAPAITSCCFGGPNHDILYVTSAVCTVQEDDLAKYPLAGSVFKVTELGSKGLLVSDYKG